MLLGFVKNCWHKHFNRWSCYILMWWWWPLSHSWRLKIRLEILKADKGTTRTFQYMLLSCYFSFVLFAFAKCGICRRLRMKDVRKQWDLQRWCTAMEWKDSGIITITFSMNKHDHKNAKMKLRSMHSTRSVYVHMCPKLWQFWCKFWKNSKKWQFCY